jgi:hypothetical protein
MLAMGNSHNKKTGLLPPFTGLVNVRPQADHSSSATPAAEVSSTNTTTIGKVVGDDIVTSTVLEPTLEVVL